MNYLARLFVVALVLCGCGTEPFEVQLKAAATELEQQVGSRPFPAWKSNNGGLTEVTFIFETDDVAKLKIADLEKFARDAVAKHVNPPPRTVGVSVQRGVKHLVRSKGDADGTA